MGFSIQRSGMRLPFTSKASSTILKTGLEEEQRQETSRSLPNIKSFAIKQLSSLPNAFLDLLPRSFWETLETQTLYKGTIDPRVSKSIEDLKLAFKNLRAKLPALEEHAISYGSNQSTKAWYHPSQKGKPTLFLSLGNLGTLRNLQDYIRFIQEKGYGCITYEYPGFGTTKGKPTENSLIETAQAVGTFLQGRKKTPPSQTVLVGQSLGCNVATYLAGKGEYLALILNSPMSSFPDLIQALFPRLTHYLPIYQHALSQWKNDEILPNLNTPIFMTAFKDDPIIPMASSQKLYKAATTPNKKWHLIGFYANPSMKK